MDWQANYFDEDYIRFYDNVITPQRTQQEVDFLQSIFDKTTKKILDIPCGFGRHSIELAKRGYKVVGVDSYQSQIRIAKENGKDIPELDFVQADMRDYVSKDFDAVIHMFSSFGYFSREEDIQIFKNLVASTKPDGLIVMDVRNPTLLVERMVRNNWKIKKDDGVIQSTEVFDPESRILSMTYIRGGITKQAKMNIYQMDEYVGLFKELHCSVEASYGDYKGNIFSPYHSPRLILVARRQSDTSQII